MTFSIITVTLNSAKTLKDTLVSVSNQRDVSVQHIIKDGGSSDGTVNMARAYSDEIQLIEEPDAGIYDAMNQGFAAAKGEFVAFINSDDFFSYDYALRDVEEAFSRNDVDIVYGDIEIINASGAVARRWRSGDLSDGRLKAKQLPHPAFFVRRSTLMRLTNPFDESYQIAADFKQQLLLINKLGASTHYLAKTLVTMRQGGASSSDLRAVVRGWRECMRAYEETTGKSGWGFVVGKVARKTTQLLPSFEKRSNEQPSTDN